MREDTWLSAFSRVFSREVKGIRESPQMAIFCFYWPLVWIVFVWLMLSHSVITDLPVAFIDNDNSPLSRELARSFSACPAVSPVAYASPAEALGAMRAGTVYAVLLIPAGYSRDQQSGTGSSIVLWLDENRYATAGTIQKQISDAMLAHQSGNTLRAALQTGAGPDEAKRMLAIAHSDFFSLANMEMSFQAFLASTLIPGLIMIGAILSFVTAFIREYWHSSVSDWIKCASGRITCATAGKLLPYYGIYVLIFVFYATLFSGVGGFNINGSLLIWIALGLACLADFAAVAVLITAISPTWRLALVISVGYAAPALPFAGFSMPMDSMGPILQRYAHCLPLTWFISGQAEEWALGAPISEMGPNFAAMACLFIIPLCIGLPLLRRSQNKRAAKEKA